MKLFLSSYFKCVAPLLKKHTKCTGEKVVFITTASKFEKVNFYVNADRKALLELGFVIEELDVSVETPMEIQYKIVRCLNQWKADKSKKLILGFEAEFLG